METEEFLCNGEYKKGEILPWGLEERRNAFKERLSHNSLQKNNNQNNQKEFIEFEFHGFNEDIYQVFSTLYHSTFNLEDYWKPKETKKWKTSNHYFQAMKFPNEDYREKIRNFTLSREASMNEKIVNNWEDIKNEIMYRANKAKFEQNIKLMEILKNTKSKEIICHNPEDFHWGTGTGNGNNYLGKILEKIRNN